MTDKKVYVAFRFAAGTTEERILGVFDNKEDAKRRVDKEKLVWYDYVLEEGHLYIDNVPYITYLEFNINKWISCNETLTNS